MIFDTLDIKLFDHTLNIQYSIIVPDDPTGLREIAEQATTTSVYIKWDESPPTTCDGITWYELSYTMDKNFSLNVTNITANNTHYNLTGLVEDATYYITLVAVNAVGKSQSVILFNGDKHGKIQF